MIIILEGPDGCGKTTLAKHLCKTFKLDYKHEGPPSTNKSAYDHYSDLLEDAHGKRVIFDRFALGELVYGPILRGISRLDANDWALMKCRMADVDAIQIACVAPYEVAFKNWHARKGELFTNVSYFRRVYDTFDNIIAREELPIYDYTVHSVDVAASIIKENM